MLLRIMENEEKKEIGKNIPKNCKNISLKYMPIHLKWKIDYRVKR